MKRKLQLISWSLSLMFIEKAETNMLDGLFSYGSQSPAKKPFFNDNLFSLEEDALIIKANDRIDQRSYVEKRRLNERFT